MRTRALGLTLTLLVVGCSAGGPTVTPSRVPASAAPGASATPSRASASVAPGASLR